MTRQVCSWMFTIGSVDVTAQVAFRFYIFSTLMGSTSVYLLPLRLTTVTAYLQAVVGPAGANLGCARLLLVLLLRLLLTRTLAS